MTQGRPDPQMATDRNTQYAHALICAHVLLKQQRELTPTFAIKNCFYVGAQAGAKPMAGTESGGAGRAQG